MENSTIKRKHQDRELEYRRKWLCQLQAEFKQICSWYGISLAAPAFRIIDSRTILGSWNPDSGTISIAAALINEYSWDTVINVLKHEMAHKYVHDYLKSEMERPHGKAFQQACKKIGVLHPFNSATGDTPKVFTAGGRQGSDREYDRKMNKVRKMLALAGSANRYEAEAAMSKANCFIRKYNLERLDSTRPSRYSYEIITTGKKRLQVIERSIARLLMDYFYVDIIYSELFEAQTNELFKTIELLGTVENVAFAGHVYGFLSHTVESLWQDYRKTTRARGKFRKTYILGLLQGVREKLNTAEQKYSAPSCGSAGWGPGKTLSCLVVARDPGLSQFIARRFPRLRKVQYRSAGIHCQNTYSAGKAAGRKITIHKTVRHNDGNLGRLLEK